jgi:hypothetical protein
MNDALDFLYPGRKRGRPRTPPVDEALKSFALSRGFRAGKQPGGWVVIPPHGYAYNQIEYYPNATVAWIEAYGRAVSHPPDETISPRPTNERN